MTIAFQEQADDISVWEPRITQVCYSPSLLDSPNSFMAFQSAHIHKASVFQPPFCVIAGMAIGCRRSRPHCDFLSSCLPPASSDQLSLHTVSAVYGGGVLWSCWASWTSLQQDPLLPGPVSISWGPVLSLS